MIKNLLLKLFIFLNKFKNINKIFSIIKNIDSYKEIKINDKNNIYLLDTNWLTRYRIESFYTKEPETIDWINKFDSF